MEGAHGLHSLCIMVSTPSGRTVSLLQILWTSLTMRSPPQPVLAVAQWAQMQGAMDQPQTPLGTFSQLMGAVADTQPRVLHLLDEADYKAVLRTLGVRTP